MAAEDTRSKDIAKHLEFLGYTCELHSDGWLYASHPVRWNFFLRPNELGVLFHSSINLGTLSDEKRSEWLEFVNRANSATLCVRFTIEHEPANGIFVLRGRTVGPRRYDRREFGAWMDTWHKDMERLREAPSPETEVEEEEPDETPAKGVSVN
jgi:hypothetical protein